MRIIKNNLIYPVKKYAADKLVHFSTSYETKIVKPNGETKILTRDLCRSFNANFLQQIYAKMAYASVNFSNSQAPFSSNQTWARASDGTQVNNYNAATVFEIDAAIAVTTHGIILSTDTGTPAPLDYAMPSKIANGTGAGQLLYQVQGGTGLVVSANQSQISLFRTFINNSGATVTVNKFFLATYNTANYVMILTEKLSSAENILDGQTYSVTIYITITT